MWNVIKEDAFFLTSLGFYLWMVFGIIKDIYACTHSFPSQFSPVTEHQWRGLHFLLVKRMKRHVLLIEAMSFRLLLLRACFYHLFFSNPDWYGKESHYYCLWAVTYFARLYSSTIFKIFVSAINVLPSWHCYIHFFISNVYSIINLITYILIRFDS